MNLLFISVHGNTVNSKSTDRISDLYLWELTFLFSVSQKLSYALRKISIDALYISRYNDRSRYYKYTGEILLFRLTSRGLTATGATRRRVMSFESITARIDRYWTSKQVGWSSARLPRPPRRQPARLWVDGHTSSVQKSVTGRCSRGRTILPARNRDEWPFDRDQSTSRNARRSLTFPLAGCFFLSRVSFRADGGNAWTGKIVESME